MKSVLISIQPKWCELIASGKKTVEVRKTRPKIDVPFKCYIYCTNEKGRAFFTKGENGNYNPARLGNRKIIGSFVCDRIIDIPYSQYFVDYYHTMPQEDLEATCLCMGHIDEYLLSKDGYGWHISNLVIYDKPKELGEFKPVCKYNMDCECVYWDECKHKAITTDWGYVANLCNKKLTRPFQSWGYVEELGV